MTSPTFHRLRSALPEVDSCVSVHAAETERKSPPTTARQVELAAMRPTVNTAPSPTASPTCAEREKIPVILSRLESVEELIKELRAKTP